MTITKQESNEIFKIDAPFHIELRKGAPKLNDEALKDIDQIVNRVVNQVKNGKGDIPTATKEDFIENE
jgi:hypothetical protein